MLAMLLQQPVASPALGRVGDAALRDTIKAIASGAEYQREVTSSFASRVLRWLGETISRFLNSIEGTPNGRAIAITALVLLVAIVVARVVIGIRAEQALREGRKPRRPTLAGTIALADAERLAASGDYTAAAHALFAALLATFALRGEVRLHASKTTGDYARELRRRGSSSFKPFQSFRSRYDRVIYGEMECSASDYASLSSDARVLLGAERAA